MTQDYDLWIRIAKECPVLCVDRVVCGFRQRRYGLSGSAEVRTVRWKDGMLRVLEKHLRNEWVPHGLRRTAKHALSQHCFYLGRNLFSQNRFKEAREVFLDGVCHRPLYVQNWIFLVAGLFPLWIIEAIRRVKRTGLHQEWARLTGAE